MKRCHRDSLSLARPGKEMWIPAGRSPESGSVHADAVLEGSLGSRNVRVSAAHDFVEYTCSDSSRASFDHVRRSSQGYATGDAHPHPS
jgi:hypothetical protein